MWKSNPCGMMIRQLHLRLSKYSDCALRQHNLTLSQLMALMILQDAPGKELSLKELERKLQVSQPDAAGIITRLEKKKMVDSYIDPDDRRIKRVRLSALGEQYYLEAEHNMKTTEEHLLDGMTNEEKETFKRLLQKACKNME